MNNAAHGTDGRYTIEGGQHRGNDGHLCPIRLRVKGVATAAPYNILNRCAVVAWAGSSGSAAVAASPGAKPLRARQGYAGAQVRLCNFRVPITKAVNTRITPSVVFHSFIELSLSYTVLLPFLIAFPFTMTNNV
jgi:hypothetical protein